MHLSQRRNHDTAVGMNGAVKQIYRSTNTIIYVIRIIAQKSCFWQRILLCNVGVSQTGLN